MKRQYLLFFSLIIFFSCNKRNQEQENSLKKCISESVNKEDNVKLLDFYSLINETEKIYKILKKHKLVI